MKYNKFFVLILFILLCITSFLLLKVNSDNLLLSIKQIYILKNVWIWIIGFLMPLFLFLDKKPFQNNRINIVILFSMAVVCIIFSAGSIFYLNTLKFKRLEPSLSLLVLSFFIITCLKYQWQ